MLNKTTKKGLSPIIAVTLLIAFSVALGAIVINFTQSSTEDLTQTAENSMENVKCSLDVSLGIARADGLPLICYNRTGTENFEVLIENKGERDLEGIHLIVFDDNERPWSFFLDSALEAHSRTRYQADISGGFVFPPTRAIISPILAVAGTSYEVCSDVELEVSDFCQCGEEDCV